MANRQAGGIALKAGATLTGLGTLATLAIFVARASDNSSITNYNRGYGPFAASLSPAPNTTPDELVRPTATPAASPTPGATALGAAMAGPATPTATRDVAHARAARVVLTPTARAPAAGLSAPPLTTNGLAPQTTVMPPAPSPPWTLSPTMSPTPSPTPWRLYRPDHAQPAISRQGAPHPGAHGHDPFAAGRTGRVHTTGPATLREPAPAPQPPMLQGSAGSPNAPGGDSHKAKDPKNVTVAQGPAQGPAHG